VTGARGRLLAAIGTAAAQMPWNTAAVACFADEEVRLGWNSHGTLDESLAGQVFPAGSLSKLLTAVTVATSVGAGLLRFDDPVTPRPGTWWPRPDGDWARPTVRELLAHCGGVNLPSLPGYGVGDKLPTLEQTLRGSPPAVNGPVRFVAAPRTRVMYSGGGYCLLQLLVQEATGLSFEDVVAKRVLHPLAMRCTGFSPPAPPPVGALTYPQAAAGLWSTAVDLARLARGVCAAFQGEPGGLLARPSDIREMFTPLLGSWGLGLSLLPGPAAAGFALGRSAGGRGFVVIHPAARLGIAFLGDSSDEGERVGELLADIRTLLLRSGAADALLRADRATADHDARGLPR
jgi:CubicO group peptidase (beta-lactamase class C family)